MFHWCTMIFVFQQFFSFLTCNFIGTLVHLICERRDHSPFLFLHEGLVGCSRFFNKYVLNKNPSVFYPVIKYEVLCISLTYYKNGFFMGKIEQLNDLSGMLTGSCGWWWQRLLKRGWASHPDFNQINSTFSCFIYSLLACYSKHILKSHTDYIVNY